MALRYVDFRGVTFRVTSFEIAHKLLLAGVDTKFLQLQWQVVLALSRSCHFLHNLILLFSHDFKINMKNWTCSLSVAVLFFASSYPEAGEKLQNERISPVRGGGKFSLVELLKVKVSALPCCRLLFSTFIYTSPRGC